MNRDEKGGGTNADGSRNSEYCSHCYNDGTWMLDMTVDEMQRRVGGMLKERGAPPSVLEQAVRAIPSLKRWRK